MPWKTDSVVSQRYRLVKAMLKAEANVEELCREAGVSRQTGYKYLRRFEQKGRKGLIDLPRTNQYEPACSQHKRSVLALRRRYFSWGARKLLYRLEQLHGAQDLPCERTVQKWLHEAGYACRPKRKRAGKGLRHEAMIASASNVLWTVDFKGWFRTLDGSKVQPLTVRDQYSKYLLTAEPVRSLEEKVIKKIFRRLFLKYGVPKAILTDRGVPFCGSGPYGLTRLSLWWQRLGIKVLFVNRKRGINNNAHEQMHQVMQKEVADQPARSLRLQTQALEKWRKLYNQVQPHEAIGMTPPRRLYRPCPKPLPRLSRPTYPSNWKTYIVKDAGHIQMNKTCYGIGRAFAGLPIGLEPHNDASYRVYFGQLLLGEIHPLIEPNIRPFTQT